MKFLQRATVLLLFLALAAGATFYCAPLRVNDQLIRYKLWRAGVHSEYIQAGPYRLHYFEAGPSDGSSLVLVHGLGSRGEDWAPLIPGLAAAGFHVYVPDLPGYGRSPKPDISYSISTQARTVIDFMHAVHLEHANLGGWSMGGWVVARLTLDHPEMVDRLAMYDAAGVYFPRTFDASLFLPTDAAGLDHLNAMLYPKPRPLPAFVARDAIHKLQANRMVIERSVAAMLNGRDLLDFRLHQIAKPTLIVWGKEDRLIPLVTGEKMHREISQSVLFVIEDCGHLAPGECAPPILKETVAFFTANPALPRSETTVPHPAS
ncbi:alpha/beta hydrolase [Granulicella sp. WH15]|uniref:alpha/beta fold hydrolase n=1 Tax=Granulicella sp. WH15 TaxID=2602070 RepID=UPI001367452F|nr:alpha/beta hydrolase [Granulicella sp. WH15]QHN04079.1 alpha/beta hydrolase [Granulicella sp. WH15]